MPFTHSSFGRRASSMLREERAATLLAALIVLVMALFLLVPVMKTISSGFYSDGEVSG